MGKIIDLFTGQEIPDDPELTVTQSLVKSSDLIDREGVDFENQGNNDWDSILKKNNVLTPKEIIAEFSAVLTLLLNKQSIDPKYCEFMINQCKDWDISDNSVIIESNVNSDSNI